jgi:hypothetical protein
VKSLITAILGNESVSGMEKMRRRRYRHPRRGAVETIYFVDSIVLWNRAAAERKVSKKWSAIARARSRSYDEE